MKRILITGGAGYIGSHTAKALAARGHEPIVLDDFSSGNRWAVRWGPLVEGSIADGDLLKRTVKRHKIDSVIHFAANAYVGESIEQPRKYFQNNVSNTLAFLHALMDCGLSDVVFSSSCATYGVPRSLPIGEEHPQVPINPYGESKLFIERVLEWYGSAHGIRFVALRYFNAAGADPENEIGECHDPETHLIPLAIRAAQERAPALKIFGTDYDTPDGTAVRDYVHVCDLASAHVKALDYLSRGGESTAFNLGTGRGYSVREIQRAVERIGGRTVPAIEKERRAGDPPILVAKADKARKSLGWEPRFTNIEEVVETAWRWHCAQKGALAAAV
jgi:UDP-arabinose 4-epimerase